MNKADLLLCIVPSDVELTKVKRYIPGAHGKVFSTLTDIKVNKTQAGYSVLYTDEDIKNMDMDVLGNNIIKLFMDNLPDTTINVQIFYLFETLDEYGETEYNVDINVVNAILTLENKFMGAEESGIVPFKYTRSVDVTRIITDIVKNYKDVNDEDDSDDDDDDDGEEPTLRMQDFFEGLGFLDGIHDEDDDDDDDDSISFMDNRKKQKKSYPQSRVLGKANNPKKSFNRHGVIITDKETKKKDEKILKEFLKEFFPGDAEWKREFRHDVLKRWMKMYCVTKKDLKELEKAHRKAMNSKRSSINTDKTLDFTRRLFNMPIDRWSDPTK